MIWLAAGSSNVRVLYEVITFFAAGITILSVWAALSRRHWFLRAIVVAAAISALLPIRAYEPALLFMVSAPLTVVMMSVTRSRFGVAMANPSATRWIGIRPMMFCYATIAMFLLMAVFSPMFGGSLSPGRVSFPSWYEWLAFGMLAMGPAAVMFMRLRTEQRTESEAARSVLGIKGFRFTLRDLLLSMVIVAISATMLASIAEKPLILDWLGMLGTGACLCVVGVTAARAVLLHRRRGIFAIGLVPTIAGSAALHTWVLPDWIHASALVSLDKSLYVFKVFLFAFLVLAMVVMIVTYLLLVAGALGEPAVPGTARNRMSRIARIALLGICLAVYGPVALVYCRMLAAAPMPDNALPDTNAFPHILATVTQLDRLNLTKSTIAEIRDLEGNQIKAQQIAEIYRVLMETLQQPSFIPMDLTGDVRVEFIDIQMPKFQKFRALAQTWDRESEEAAIAQQFDRAADFGVANMRLGSKLQIGGVVESSLIGIAIEEIGMDQVIRVRHQISWSGVRQFLEAAEANQHARELPRVTIARDAVYNERAYSWRDGLGRKAPVALASMAPGKLGLIRVYEEVVNRRDATLQLLVADFAVRMFKHDRGQLPESLAEIQPGYLSAIPLDPYSGRSLIYRRAADTYVLYSVGRDGKDDGGRFGTLTDTFKMGFDLDVDTGNRQTTPARAPITANQ